MSGPNFEELMEGASPDEEARLRRVHDMLLTAGPPPELPQSLEEPPVIKRQRPPALTTLPRRRFGAVLVAAAGIAAAAFFAGYVIGGVGSSTSSATGTTIDIPMRPTPAAPGSAAVLAVARDQGDKNVPMTLTVSNLKHLPRGGYYELWLTRAVKSGGKTTQKLIVVCGTFIQNADRVEVKMNAPYTLDKRAGWVITRHLRGAETNPVVLTT